MKALVHFWTVIFHAVIWLLLLPVGNLCAETSLLVPASGIWKYLDDGSDQGIAWRMTNFNDASWRVGFAQFGYGDADEETTLNYGSDPNNKFITYYFRNTFSVGRGWTYTNLALAVMRDDGVVVYLNGTEVFRNNMPAGPIDYRTLASTNVPLAAESIFHNATIPASALVNGMNVIAVEIHQVAANNADVSFDLELVGSFDPSALPITRGPYLQQSTPTGMIVRWRSSIPTDTYLQFCCDDEGESVVMQDALLSTEHYVRLTGLNPDSFYRYRVRGPEMEMFGDYFFKTSPTNAKPTRVWVIGDSGTRNADQLAVYRAFCESDCNGVADVWLMLGDNAYPSGTDSDYQAAVFNVYRELLTTTPVWPTIGNHDILNPALSDFPYVHIFNPPENGEAGGIPSGTKRYYSFDYANIHFVCLDAMSVDRSSNGPMCSWLRADLADCDKEWIIAFWHHPPYSSGHHNSDLEIELIQMRQNVVPILDRYGVDLVLCGHSHSYERSFLLNGHYGVSSTLQPHMLLNTGSGRRDQGGPYFKPPNDPDANSGTVYAVVGSSGQVTPATLGHPAMFTGELRLGSLLLEINGPSLDAKFLYEYCDRSEFPGCDVGDYFTIYKGIPVQVVANGLQNGLLSLSWNARPNFYYLVERATDLHAEDWEPATEGQRGIAGVMMAQVPISGDGSAAFYRIREYID